MQRSILSSRFLTFLLTLSISLFIFSCTKTPERATLRVFVHETFASADSYELESAIQEFEERENVTVEWISYGSISLAFLEKMKDPSFKIDLLYGVDNTLLVDFKESGLFHPYLPENSDLLLSEIRLDKENLFTPINYGWLGFEYSLDDWDELFPLYLTDLAKAPWKGEYILTNPRTSDVGLLFALWLDATGFDVEKELPLLKRNAFAVAPNWGSAYTLYISGEAPFVLTYGTSPAYHAFVEGDEDQRTILDKENSYLHVEFMGIAKNSHDIELSQRFLDHMLSTEVQTTLPRKVWVLPSRAHISLPEEFRRIVHPEKLLSHTPERIKELKEVWFASDWF